VDSVSPHPEKLKKKKKVGFEVLTTVIMECSRFWDIMQYSPLNVNRCFGGTCLLLQGLRISHARDQHEADSKQSKSSKKNTGSYKLRESLQDSYPMGIRGYFCGGKAATA
jgi:hypothetical protein